MSGWGVTNLVNPDIESAGNTVSVNVVPSDVIDDSDAVFWIAPQIYRGNKVYDSLCLSLCLSVCLSVSHSVCLSICVYVSVSMCLCLRSRSKTAIAIISGTCKATDFKFGRYIHRIRPNKSPLKI